jgi:predicted DCC family thiol-disulfide oxidoreductase YuxK
MNRAVGYHRVVAPSLVLYDGVCGLCNQLVHFLLRQDRHARLRFATLQGSLARELLIGRGLDPSDLDTVYVVADWRSPNERVLARSRAVLHAVAQLGGTWTLLANIARLIPPPLADIAYRFVARIRYRLFGRYDTCPLPKPEWKDRILD